MKIPVTITNVYQRVDRAVTITATTALEQTAEEFAALYGWRWSEAVMQLSSPSAAEADAPGEVVSDTAGGEAAAPAAGKRRNSPSANLRWAIEEYWRARQPGIDAEELERRYEVEIAAYVNVWRRMLGKITGANKP